MVQPRLMMPNDLAWLVVSHASAQMDFMHLHMSQRLIHEASQNTSQLSQASAHMKLMHLHVDHQLILDQPATPAQVKVCRPRPQH